MPGPAEPSTPLQELGELPGRIAATFQSLKAASAVSFGASEKDAVYREDKLTLYHYRPIAPSASLPPVLIVYALVNRPYMMDLQPDRSLIRRLLELGLDLYLIDWGYPDGGDRFTDLNDYINGYLHRCLGVVLREHRLEATTVLGVCQGGTFSLCYAALHPGRVRNLITMVTPVDFQTSDNLLSKWVQGIDVDALVAAHGIVPGEVLNAAYVSLMPFRLLQQKYVNLLDGGGDQAQIDNFMRMEKWIFDSPAQAGAAFAQFARWFFQENRLLKGTLEIGGRRVDLKQLTQPLLNIYAKQDHLVPPTASTALEGLVGSKDYLALGLDVGHIGMYVSGRSQRELPQAIAYWLQRR
ncbi:MAG TPA: class III poly(R)-hydroxyalkanoic acid synthase subunit PhaC [Steroidobacteraceae bacterium]|nr:class III poly(R)-hydroxyalkanoic acid synthase subunit PhaC [Steroidobacteraceae bacterium]